MLSSVLKSDRAVAINIEIMRAFVRLRNMILSNKDWPASSTFWSAGSKRMTGAFDPYSRPFAS